MHLESIFYLKAPNNLYFYKLSVRSFLGSVGFYRCFITDFSKIALPLTTLLQKDVSFIIDDKCNVSFDTLK